MQALWDTTSSIGVKIHQRIFLGRFITFPINFTNRSVPAPSAFLAYSVACGTRQRLVPKMSKLGPDPVGNIKTLYNKYLAKYDAGPSICNLEV
jgi:hypothetical protein